MTAAPLTLTARGPEDLLAAAPLVLGFEPADSLVLMTFGGLRPFHARLDIPPRSELLDEVALATAESLLEPAREQRITAAALLFYTDDPDAAERLWRPLRRGCGRSGIALVTALRTDGRRYYPLQGERRLREVGVPYDVSAHPFLTRAIVDGQVTYQSREEMVATIDGDPAAQERVLAALTAGGWFDRGLPVTGAEIRAAGRWVIGLVGTHAAAGTVPSDADLARMLWQVQQVRVRDSAWSLISRSTSPEHLRFWSAVVPQVPEPLVAGPAGLLGWAAWQAGHGALAWAAVDRCRATDPDNGLARVLALALENAVPPDTVTGEGLAWDEGLGAC